MGASGSSPPAGGPIGGFFEGTEKRIEVDFQIDPSSGVSLLKVDRQEWEEVVRLSQTECIGSKTTSSFTSYLLSESSLLVYPQKVVLKTCGRTVPLQSVEKIIEIGKTKGMNPEWFCYSRKNFLKPSEQPEQHRSFEAEMTQCQKICGGGGDAYTLGAMTNEHWLLYNTDFLEIDSKTRGDFTVDLMMYGLSADARKHFYTDEPEGSRKGAEDMTNTSGLGSLVTSIQGEVDDYCFSPCGYSCNIHAGEAYGIIHVTPEEECSYASFETNFGSNMLGLPTSSVAATLNDLVGKVLDIFKPQRFTMTLFIDAGAEESIGNAPFGAVLADDYKRLNMHSYCFETDYKAQICNYRRR